MKYAMLALLTMSFTAHALRCDTDSDCLSAGLSLIKKARKLGTCDADIKAVIPLLGRVASPGAGELEALENCVDSAKYDSKVDKRRTKRLERIQKALNTPKAVK